MMKKILSIMFCSAFLLISGIQQLHADTIEIRVNSSTDDAEEHNSGTYLDSSDLELIEDTGWRGSQTVGIRFTGINIPRGATINDARIQFVADRPSSGSASLIIKGIAENNPATFSSAAGNISSRPMTQNTINWNPQNWLQEGDQNTRQRTPDLTSLVQEIINRNDWNQGQSIAFAIEGNGTRAAKSFDGSGNTAPELTIDFTPPGNTSNQPPTAAFTNTVNSGQAPLVVYFDATNSSDDNTNTSDLNYAWDFGNGATASGQFTDYTYTEAGNYTITLTVTDAEGLDDSDSVEVIVTSPGTTGTIVRQIASGADDAEENSSGDMYLDSSDLEMITDTGWRGDQVIGLRFTDLNIPRGAEIQNAYIQFQADRPDDNNAQLNLRIEDTDSAGRFTTADNNISGRPLANGQVEWQPSAWQSANDRTAAQRSPDLKSLVQQVVNRSGWQPGQALAFVITGSGTRSATAFENGEMTAATLHIQYGSISGNTPPVAVLETDKDTGAAPLTISFKGQDSYDPDGVIYTYQWDFGDGGSPVQSREVVYTFNQPGQYTVSLRLVDNEGAITTARKTITATDDPVSQNGSWEEADVTFSGIGVAIDNTEKRLLLPLPAGYANSTTLLSEITAVVGYSIALNGQRISNGSHNFGLVRYGDTATIDLYQGDELVRSGYQLVFTNLPVVDMSAAYIVDEPKNPGTFRLMSQADSQDTAEQFMGIEFRGDTSQRYPKKPFSLELVEEPYSDTADEEKLVLLNLREDGDWILDAAYRDTTFVRNLIGHELWREMRPFAHGAEGQSTVNGRLTEVVLNHQYQGVHVLHEKVDRKLLDLSKVDVPDNGGWASVDFSNPENGSVLYKATGNLATLRWPPELTLDRYLSNHFEQKYPKASDIVRWEPLAELVTFLNQSSDTVFIQEIANRVDISSVVDYWLLANLMQSTDTIKKNYYLARNESDKFFMVPWDMDATFNMDWLGAVELQTEWWEPDTNLLISRLLRLPETGFNQLALQRWNALKSNGTFAVDSVISRFETYQQQLMPNGLSENAANRNFTRWPESGGDGVDSPELRDTNYLRNWLTSRISFVDGKLAELAQ